MKKIAAMLLALALTMALVACGSSGASASASTPEETPVTSEPAGSSDPAEEPAPETNELTIAYFGPHQNNEYQVSLREAVEAACASRGVNCKVYIADNDPAKQISQIEQAINEGVDGIVIDPCSYEGTANGIKAAHDAGIPLVTVHETVSNQELATAFVGSDLQTGGQLKMEQVMADLPDGGDLAILYGPLGHTAQIAITDGYMDALTAADAVEKYPYVFEGEGNWAAEDALELATNWLSTGKNIDAFVCNNDGMAIGVLQACRSAGRTDIPIYGLDAQQDVLAEIKAGNIRATIWNDFVSEADVGVDICLRAINGETVEPFTSISPKVVTIDNVDEFIN